VDLELVDWFNRFFGQSALQAAWAV